MGKWARVIVGLALVWGALGVVGYRLGWQLHSGHGQQALLRSARAADRSTSSSSNCTTPGTPTSDGQLAGVLNMPTLNVTAPVEQGTDDPELNVAVGHADSTPWPGTAGTAVLLAHDVSYFAHIDQLQPGDTIDYQVGCVTHVFRVTGHVVVAAGAPIPPLSGNGLVLDTCWPTNALWYTPNRYLVEAQEASVQTSKTAASGSGQSWPTGYTTSAPSALVAQGLTLENNEEPMGTLTLTGTPDTAWAQSPAPLAVEAAALEAYFGALRSAAQQRSDWWSALAPGVTMPAPLSGATVTAHNAPLDVTITAQGDKATAVTLSTIFTLSGGPAPGRYSETATEALQGLNVLVTNWEVTRG
ncbi:MAG TPA: class D sortase [Acidimicrobiales bacterium]|nr:class D sortase [Acidimicrobiales bacterium]